MDTKQVIASETIDVYDENMEIGRQIVANQPVPPDLVKAYYAAIGKTPPESTDGDKDPADDSLTKEDLLALKREELDERATEAGVESPEKLGTKAEVVEAILAAGK